MPTSPPTPCRQCKARTTNKGGYCDEHKDLATGWARRQKVRGSDTQRGYGWAWRKLRKTILERDSYLCQAHLKIGKLVQAKVVDHKVPKAEGGIDDPSNLQSLCNECHRDKTQEESARGRGSKSLQF